MKAFLILVFLSFNSALMAQIHSPIVIAHRGASGYLPEHTLEAKAMAHAMHADFIEQDLVLSKDDIPVVLHDIYIDTVSDVATRFPERKRADGRYYAIDFMLVELKQLKMTERFNVKTGKQVYENRFPKGLGNFQIATLEEEIQLIQGLNRSRQQATGIYPEIKQPAWHCKQGHDISRIVLPILQRYGYATKHDACWLQCFEYEEVERIRNELKWEGKLVMLLGPFHKDKQANDEPDLSTHDGLKLVAKIADGIGPSIAQVLSGKTPLERRITDLVETAHSLKMVVHPYTMRIDELPTNVVSAEELMEVLFAQAKVDGLFSDFPDVTAAWLAKQRAVRNK